MLLFACTAVLAALILGSNSQRTSSQSLWLSKKAISNWMKSQPQKFGKAKENIHNPKSYADTGLLSEEQDILAERPIPIANSASQDEYIIYGSDEKRNRLFVKMIRFHNDRVQADVLLAVNGTSYQMSYQGEALSPYEFSLGNLKMEMVEPFRTWRIWYNGIMEYSNMEKAEERKLAHVVFNFLWKALESPMDNRRNGNGNLLANHLSSSGIFGENLPSLLKILPEGYSQMGTLHGPVHINGGHQYPDELEEPAGPTSAKEEQLYLFGFRTREIITTDLETIFPLPGKSKKEMGDKDKWRLELFAMCEENGNGFRLTSYDDGWTDGRMLWASNETTLITGIDCSPAQMLRGALFPKLFNITDSKGTSRVETWSDEGTYQLSNTTQITYLKMSINGKKANGVLIRKPAHPLSMAKQTGSWRCVKGCDYPPSVGVYARDDDDMEKQRYFLEFSNPVCLKVPLVGGKGASLARLEMMALRTSDAKVETARGFCVTTRLFRELLDLDKFDHVFNNSSGNDQRQSLEEACSEIMKLIKSSDAARTQLSAMISPWVQRIFGENRNQIRFAVRSSGVLEDGSDLSSAGQNETFLGVAQDLIPEKVVECWASLFTAQSVQYRLNHGQPAVSEMGVVIQEMVDAKSAGVIFTADPRTGNPFHMFITANYGLGESVVSGSCDPDFITLIRHVESENPVEGKTQDESCGCIRTASLGRDKWWKDVTIGKKVLGEKRTKIICTSSSSSSSSTAAGERATATTQEISMSDKDSHQFCVDEESAIRLGVVAAEIELLMGHHKPVDIEWAIDQNGQIFILQCRNLTALDAWTDFEILHELHAPIRTKLDRFTTANTGEVLPKAIYTITQTMNRCLDFTIQKQLYMRRGEPFPLFPYATNSCPLFNQRLFINMFQTLYVNVEKEITTDAVCVDQTVFGRQVIDEEILKITEERFGLASGLNKLTDFAIQMKFFMTFKSIVEKASKKYRTFKLDYLHLPNKAADVYREMCVDLIHMYEIALTHLVATQSSSGSQVFLFLFLTEGKKPSEWSSSLFEDASKLLSVFANVESAEMVSDMDILADEIIRYGGNNIAGEFLEVPPEKALAWLRGNERVSLALDVYFEKHGHRGFSELDIGEQSWKSNPISFLPILRNILKNKLGQSQNGEGSGGGGGKMKAPHKSDDELLNSLSSNLKPITRRLLKLILPTCRNSVACREKSKSLYVRVIGEFKEKYQQLAKLMVAEHLLPSASLIVHLTHFEIGQLVNKDISSSTILHKAMKRQKIYPTLEKLEFPEISFGIPEEIDTAIPVSVTDTIQATPVSRGIARGVAKVCMNVEEASENLKPGDILITHGTDIAWSPFFPILGGVVTELGGLISHGAVVAREYGLPCIVGAVNATKIFKTGDKVILDAGKGVLSKIDE